ncbi:uncharacterized protein LOC142802797 [Rhipicephalus microplus]|uniref:uncharacterized protein LOC142802797 n=1 Tax=Rhipicephalus microplus TaxID=6941 RepID=UPI003F6BD2B3
MLRQKTWEALFWASKVLALVWRNVWIRRLRRQMVATVLELALAAFALAHLPPGSKAGAASAGAYHERELQPPEQLDMYHVSEQLVLDVSTDVLEVFADKIKQKGRFTNMRHRYMRLFVNGREVDEPTAPGRIPKDKMRKIWITVVNSEEALLDKCANESFKGVCALVRTNVVGNDKSVNYTCYLNGHLSPPVMRTRRAGYALRIAPIEGEISECQNLIESVLLGNYITDALPSVHAASQMFPLPRYPTPPPMDNVIASMCFLITYMMPFSRSVWTIVEENSSGMASMLRSMGTSDMVYWLAHFVSTFLHISFYSLMAVFFMMYNTYQVTPGSFSFEDYQHVRDYAPYLNEQLVRRDLLVALFTLFGVQTTLHVMLLSCVNTRRE